MINIYKQPRQESIFYCFSFIHYLRKIYRALHGNAMFLPFGGTQTMESVIHRSLVTDRRSQVIGHWSQVAGNST